MNTLDWQTLSGSRTLLESTRFLSIPRTRRTCRMEDSGEDRKRKGWWEPSTWWSWRVRRKERSPSKRMGVGLAIGIANWRRTWQKCDQRTRVSFYYVNAMTTSRSIPLASDRNVIRYILTYCDGRSIFGYEIRMVETEIFKGKIDIRVWSNASSSIVNLIYLLNGNFSAKLYVNEIKFSGWC